MSRPDGRGFRLRFAADRSGGELAVVFAAPELGIGASGRGVPVNVTLLDGAGERIYGTQGDSRCVFDEVEQRAIEDPTLPPRSYRVSARGFCVAPARALDGEGSVLLTRFDFVGLVTYQVARRHAIRPAGTIPVKYLLAVLACASVCAASAQTVDASPIARLAALPRSEVQVETAGGRHVFQVWVADNDRSRQQGLMFIKELSVDRGMLFLFKKTQLASFWMKNTYVSLDIVFIAADGVVANIVHDTQPLSLAPIESVAPVTAVLELAAGTAARIGLIAGDRVRSPVLATP